jgi:hypothetical protein
VAKTTQELLEKVKKKKAEGQKLRVEMVIQRLSQRPGAMCVHNLYNLCVKKLIKTSNKLARPTLMSPSIS